MGTHPRKALGSAKLELFVLFLLAGIAFAAPVLSAGKLTPDEAAVVEAVKKVKPAVVGIKTFGEDLSGEPIEVASGVIFRSDGYIITNAHVLRGAHHVIVYTAGGKRYEAALVAPDNQSDLAVLRINAQGLPTVTFGDSNQLALGQTAIAIGNPLSFGWTVTKGVVSALHRQVTIPNVYFKDLIQTDAAINLGNSGGPLVATDGEVIGINTLIYQNPNLATQGIGFAIPSNIVRNVAGELLHLGNPLAFRKVPIKLGIQMYDLTPQLSTEMGLNVVKGIVIQKVEPGSPAAKGKLAAGDVLTKVDGYQISGTEFLIQYVEGKSPGTVINFEIWRRGIRQARSVRLESSSR